MTWFRVGGAGIPASLKNAMNAVFNKKFGTSGQNYPPKQWPDDVNLMGPLPEGTASGSIANISDGADDVPTKSVIAQILHNTIGKAYVRINQTGKNLFILPDENFTINGVEFKVQNDKLVIDGTSTGSNVSSKNQEFKDNFSFGLPAGTYYFNTGTWSRAVYIYDLNDDSNALVTNNGSFTLSEYTVIYIGFYIGVNQTIDNVQFDGYLVQGSSASAYSSQWSRHYSVALNAPSFGGSVDFVSGEVINTYKTIRIGDLSFAKVDGCQHTFRCQTIPRKYANRMFNVFSDDFTTYTSEHSSASNITTLEQGNDNTIFINAGSATIYISTDSSYDNKTAANFLTDYADAILVYETNAPTTDLISGQIISTVYGENKFWNDADGETAVIYRRDIELALQAVSSSRGLMMASRPITQLVGEESDPDQVNELVEDDENDIPEQLNEVVENDETEQEGEDDAR